MKDLSFYYKELTKPVMGKEIKTNSKEVKKNDVFVCVKGKNVDHHRFAKEACERGASLIVASRKIDVKVPVIYVKNTNKEVGHLAKKFYDYKDSVHLVGVTGTDGKTTVSTILKELLGTSSAYLGTNGFWYLNRHLETKNTTIEIAPLYQKLSFLEKKKIPYLSMEVSSEALLYNRLRGIVFDGAILTNITSDHMNVHKTMENYVKSKCRLFRKVRKSGIIVLNKDDSHYQEILPHCFAKVVTYGKKKEATFQIQDIHLFSNQTIFTFTYQKKTYEVKSPLIGEFNVYNLMASIAYLMSMGIPFETLRKRFRYLRVKGRCEVLKTPLNATVILDYAHTEQALRSVLSFLSSIKEKRLITVVGSAGGRDQGKRSKMGLVVQTYSDLVVYTMDDPRWEDPLEIILDMLHPEKRNYVIIVDRKTAIFYALDALNEKDILIICGKGRDSYMAIGEEKIPYCDAWVVENYFSS